MSNGQLLHGQQFERSLDIPIPFTQQMCDTTSANPLVGTTGLEITPNDAASSVVRTYDLTAIAALYASIIEKYADLITLKLPPILKSVTCNFNSASGGGSSSQSGSGESAGSYASLSLSLHASSQGSASLLPNLIWQIKQVPQENIQAKVYLFFELGSAAESISSICSILSGPNFANATVNPPILFAPQIVTLGMLGQNVNLSATADVQERVEISATLSTSNVSQTLGSGTGYSYEFGVTQRTIQIPETIHTILSVGSATDTASAAAAAEVDFPAGTSWTAENATENLGPVNISGSVFPSVITATTPTTIPITGLYLVKLDVSPFAGFGFSQYRAVVVDFSQFSGFT